MLTAILARSTCRANYVIPVSSVKIDHHAYLN